MPKIVSPQVKFTGLLRQVQRITPKITNHHGHFLNLLEGAWQRRARVRNAGAARPAVPS